MKHLLMLMVVLLGVSSASAEDTLAPLVLEVRAERVSRSALEQALRRELSSSEQGAGAPQGELSLQDVASDTVRLTYRDATGKTTSRELIIAADDPEALEKITIAAANLVRDQMGVLDELSVPEPAPPAQVAAPAPVVAPVAEAPRAPVYDPCHPEKTIPFAFDLAPRIGASSTPLGREASRRISLGFIGTLSGGARGAELSVGVNIDRRGSCGAMLATLANVSLGPMRGVQLGLHNFVLRTLAGAQLGVTNVAGAVHGTQFGVANIALGQAFAQLAVFNFAMEAARVQLGVSNFTFGESRVQAGVLNFGRTRGRVQLGVTNVLWGDTRVQLGVANIARDEARVQVGVFNYAGRSSAPVGVVSVVRHGTTTLDAWAFEDGSLLGGITHGGKYIHNVYAAGERVGRGTNLPAFVLGIGARALNHTRVTLDVDALHEFFTRFASNGPENMVERVRVLANVWLHERVGIFGSLGYALAISDSSAERSQGFAESTFRRARDDGGAHRYGVYGFPSLSLGVRVLLSSPDRERE